MNDQLLSYFLFTLQPQQPIKGKHLLSIYSQLYVVQYGEFGRSLVGIKDKLLLSIHSQLYVVQYGEIGR